MATYSLLAEKSTAVTCPNGVLEVGQLSKEVRLGRWIYEENKISERCLSGKYKAGVKEKIRSLG
jgi:hypothetical protein